MVDRHTMNRAERTAQLATKSNVSALPRAGLAQAMGGGVGFETALTFIKLGYKAQRAGWNGKGMHVEICTDWVSSQLGVEDRRLPFIMMHTATGEWVPWLISQTDALAHDWVVVDESGIAITEGAPVGATSLGNQ